MNDLFENLQLLKESKNTLSIKKESRNLNVGEFNRLKFALNKHNNLKKIFILHAIADDDRYNKNDYTIKLSIYGSFIDYEANKEYHGLHDSPAQGEGVKLYTIYINTIDESIKFEPVIDPYYINKYVKMAITDNKLNGMDPDTVISNIKTIAETSQEDVKKVLESKNFIYRLTGKSKQRPNSDYNLDLDESAKLTEDFDPSMPTWLMKAIRLRNQDMYGHADYQVNYNLDTLKWTVDKLPEKGKLSQFYDDNKIVAVLIDRSGDEHNGDYIVYCPALGIGNFESIYINGRERNIEKMSMKALAPYVKEMAYADKTNFDDVLKTRQDRARNKPTGDNVRYSNDHKPYHTQLDKSGYIVDPDKYTKKLAQLHQQDYVTRLEDLYVVLTDTKNKFKEFISRDDFLPDAKDDDSPYSVGLKSKSRDFESINRKYNEAIQHYRYALKQLDKIKDAKSDDFSNKPSFEEFKKEIQASEKNVVEILDIIEK